MSKPLLRIEKVECTILQVPKPLGGPFELLAYHHGKIGGKPFYSEVVRVLGVEGVSIRNSSEITRDEWERKRIEHYLMGVYFRKLDPPRYAHHALNGVLQKPKQETALPIEGDCDQSAF